jgi:hypothetical protein
MRTTLDIDADILETAKEIARKEKRTAGAVISDLARRGFYGMEQLVAESSETYQTRNGVPLLPPTGSIVSESTIRKIRDTEGI